MWTFLLIILGISFALLFMFFAGVQRMRSRHEDSIPEEYLAIISDFPPEFFVPFQPTTRMPEISEEEKTREVQFSPIFRAVQYIGYQTAKLDSKVKQLKIPKKIRRARLAYKLVDILGFKRSAKIAASGYRDKRKLVAKTQT